MSQPPALVGRASVLTVLREALSQAEARRGQLVLLSGEAGIGKSALADLVAREAEARHAQVIWGRAWELAEAPPYFPVWPCLRALGIEPPRGASAEAGAFHLWEEVLGALGRASSQKLVVWLLEDLHAADLLTLDLMSFLALPLRALGVLVVITLRDPDPRLSGLAHSRLTRLGRDGRLLRLEALGHDDVRALAEAVTRRSLAADEAASLAEVTGGNPLFVVECARAWRSAGVPGPAPASVRQLVTGRVALLGEATRRALAAGAVLGRDFSAAQVARMIGSMPAQIIDQLLSALRAGILLETGPGQFRYSHILVRDAIEDELAPAERAELHARAERALAAQGDSVDVLVERARHALAALRPEADPVGLALRAAQLLEAQGAHDRAFAMHQRIAEARAAGLLVPALAELDPVRVAHVARAAGRHAEADRLCGEALAAARAAGDADRLAVAALALGADLRPGHVNHALVAALREALSRLGPEPSLVGCRVLARLAAAQQPAEDPQVPIAMARQAVAAARAAGDPATLLEVLHSAGSAMVDFAPLAERLAMASELRDRALADGDRPRVCTAYARLAHEHLTAGEFAAWEDDLERLSELSLELGHPRYRWRPLLLESMRALAVGDVEASDRAVVEAQQHTSVTDDLALTMSLGAHQLCKALLWHDDETLRALLPRMLDFAKGAPDALAPLFKAACLARLEDREGTMQELAVVRGRARLSRAHELYAMPDAWALAGTPEERRGLRELLAARDGTQMRPSHVPVVYDGPIARALGVLDSSLGEHAAAEAGLRQALAEAEARGHRAWIAQIRYDLARALAAAGRDGDAARFFAAAAELAAELRMTGLVTRARARLGAAPVAAELPVRLALVREGEIWRIEHGARLARVKHSRGLELLARLIERDGEEIHVLALASDVGQAAVESDAGELIDAQARREYKARLEVVTAELAQAEARADLGRVARLRHEHEALSAELVRAVGLGGRVRAAASATERARVNVQRRLKDAVARVADADPELGQLLARSVHTGTYCCFRS